MIDHLELYKRYQKRSVLFIEDYAPLQKAVRATLNEYFGLVVTAVDGKAGLEQYIAHHTKNGSYFDIVITDINMPKMSGLELSRELMRINPSQTIIVISADKERDNLISFINLGVTRFIPKPVNVDVLLKTLGELY